MTEPMPQLAAGRQSAWLVALRRYLAFAALANLIWELAQLPLYTIWADGSPREIVFAAIHCTAGDVVIAGGSLLGVLLLVGRDEWPDQGYLRVAALTLIAGFSYTVYSEWVNTEVRGSWAYADLMPTVPPTGAGLAPLLQWIVVPLAAFWWARRSRIYRARNRIGGEEPAP